jgi:diguanylate cyclase (GGDEF)-like protein
VAEVLRREVRIEDIAGRWDGDTFEVVAVGTGSRGATALAERLRRRASWGAERHDALHSPLRLSLGVAAGQDSATRLVRRALLALGDARTAGGDRVATA